MPDPIDLLDVAALRAEYEERVKVIVVCQDGDGEQPGDAKFWLHTWGMERYGLPDLEVVDVPALWVEGAGAFLNGWAFYSTRQRQIRAGETMNGGLQDSVLVRAVESPDPWWAGRPALRLVPERVNVRCASCEPAP